MSTPALYDALYTFKDIHRVVMEFGNSLEEEQLRWLPKGYSSSIGFHLWHLARESDFLKAAILEHTPQLGPAFGEAREIWTREKLAEKWGFPAELHSTLGSGMSDEAAAALPLPPKDELLGYLSRAYADLEAFIELLDLRYPSFDAVDEELSKKLRNVRLNLLVFLTHDCRHLGMMECLKGLQTGFGSATEKRNEGRKP